jgi:hypothetical protein
VQRRTEPFTFRGEKKTRVPVGHEELLHSSASFDATRPDLQILPNDLYFPQYLPQYNQLLFLFTKQIRQNNHLVKCLFCWWKIEPALTEHARQSVEKKKSLEANGHVRYARGETLEC